MEGDAALIFVYGTLRAGSGHPMGERLAREADWIARGSVPGRLYLISWYPGLTRGENRDSLVTGDLYRLREAETLAWLDEYEASAGESPEYERVRERVQLASGGEAEAWVYYYLGPVERAELIPHGDFLRRGREAE